MFFQIIKGVVANVAMVAHPAEVLGVVVVAPKADGISHKEFKAVATRQNGSTVSIFRPFNTAGKRPYLVTLLIFAVANAGNFLRR